MVDIHNPIQELTQVQRDQLVSSHVFAAEKWLRNLVHYRLSQSGKNYITGGPWKNELKKRVYARVLDDQQKYSREIDATSFEDIIYMVTMENEWLLYFREPLGAAYPNGRMEAKTFLERIKDARNDVGHLLGTSARQVEQAICYTGDLIDSIRDYFVGLNMDREFNVPMIVRYADNKGNKHNLEGVSTDINSRIIDWRTSNKGNLRPGDVLLAEVEVDPSFPTDGYDVSCAIFGGDWQNGAALRLPIVNHHVGEQLEVRFRVITKLDWHRQHGVDDMLIATYRVLPPI